MVQPSTLKLVAHHIGEPRFATYLALANNHHHDALMLYRWNIEMSGALQEALGFAEVCLRNAVDRELRTWNAAQPPRNGVTYGTNWVEHPAGPLWAVLNPKRRNSPGRFSTHRDALNRALESQRARPSSHRRHGAPIDHDDIVAHMTFGTWKKLLPTKNSADPSGIGPIAQRRLWQEGVKDAFPHHQHPTVVYYWVERLHALRNRVAHIEPLCDINAMSYHRTVSHLLRAIDPPLSEWFGGTSRIPEVSRRRPC